MLITTSHNKELSEKIEDLLPQTCLSEIFVANGIQAIFLLWQLWHTHTHTHTCRHLVSEVGEFQVPVVSLSYHYLQEQANGITVYLTISGILSFSLALSLWPKHKNCSVSWDIWISRK